MATILARLRQTTRQQRIIFSAIMAGILLFTTLFIMAPGISAAGRVPGSAVFAGVPHVYQAATSPTVPSPSIPQLKGTPPRDATDEIKHPFTPSMAPLTIDLSSGSALRTSSSDSQLDVDIPSQAITTTDVAAAAGKAVKLVITQIAPGGGSTTGDHISLGTYLLQVQDGTGKEVSSKTGLRQNVKLTWHSPTNRSPVPLEDVIATMNGTVGTSITALAMGKNKRIKAVHDATAHTVSAIIPLAVSTNSVSFDSNAPAAYFGKPDSFQNALHTGDLTTSIPIDLPQGPGGLTPPLTLSYSSGAISATHNVQAAAPWVGDGWNLDMGSITWSETNAATRSGGSAWASTWSISDPYGTTGELIPPTTNISTYYDDTPNPPAGTVQWHTSVDSHAKIYSHPLNAIDYSNFSPWNGSTGYHQQPPCFDVWLPNGIYEQFGCGFDSRQWYVSGTTNYVSKLFLNFIADTHGNQMHIWYDQDMASKNGVNYPRDVVINRIEYDSPNCLQQSWCGNWNPLVQVLFQHSTSVAHPFAGAPSCAAPGNGLRCDDPVAENAPDAGTPQLIATQVLNEVDVQVRPTSSSAWSNLRSYTLEYGQSALSPNAINDPNTGNLQSVAGFLTLDRVNEHGTDNATAYPPQTFQYTIPASQYYLDSSRHPAADAGCGPAYNSGQIWNGAYVGCFLWSRSYNSFYMTGADNGQGLHQSFTWANTHNNSHGTPGAVDLLNPLYCPSQSTTVQAQYPCDQVDDMAWSHLAMTSRTATVKSPTSVDANAVTTSTWNYNYLITSLSSRSLCGDCWVGMYWGNQDDNDYLDYYNGQFRGFLWAVVGNPDGSKEEHSFITTTGWGVWDHTKVPACSSCGDAADWLLWNAATGHPDTIGYYNPYANGSWPLMKRVIYAYNPVCPPVGVGASSGGSWNNNNVAELDPDNPVGVCDVQTASVKTYITNGVTNYTDTNVPWSQVSYTYNSYGLVTGATTTGNDLSTTPSITTSTAYVSNDAINASTNPPTGVYMIDRVGFSDIEDPGNTTAARRQCTYTSYDGQGYTLGQTSGLTRGLATQTRRFADCGTAPNYAPGTAAITTTTSYTATGQVASTIDADANGGSIPGHVAATGSCTGSTSCTQFDSNYGTLPIQQTNVLNQSVVMNYDSGVGYGFGLWPKSVTDNNGQTSSTTYDPLGRTTSTTAPGETAGLVTSSLSYTVTCATTGADIPCLEVDTTQRRDATTTVTSRDFYDGLGRHVESRHPASGGGDVLQYARYDQSGRMAFLSQPYAVAGYTGPAGAAAYAIPDTSKPGTQTSYNGLGQVTIVTEPNSAVTSTTYTTVCGVAGVGSDTACYAVTTTTDANGHQTATIADALGRLIYAQSWTGTAGSFSLYRTIKHQYDVVGNEVSTTLADGTHTATKTYNALGQITASTDPDLGNYTYTYDPNGNVISTVDPRGASGTVYHGYDGLNRPVWQSTHSDGSTPLSTMNYDSTAAGNQGIGRLTSETFASGPNQATTGGYAYTYDIRGRQTGWTMSVGTTSYPFTTTFNDASQPLTLTYPDGAVQTTGYTAQGWLASVTEQQGTTTTTLVNNLLYAGQPGASQQVTGATVGNGVYQWSLGYDTNLRVNDTKAQKVATSTTLFDQTRSFDAVGNVLSTNTTLAAGTDNQVFCYDAVNRLTWAGNNGTPACGGTVTTGTLTSGRYQQPYAYDVLDRLTTGPKGTGYAYADPAHVSAVTSAPSYTATYDVAGSMTARSGQPMTYDALRRLLTWQDKATAPTKTESYAYNGAGERVQQVNGTTTTTYVGGFEEVSKTGTTTNITKYYQAGPVTAVKVNGVFSYLVQDSLKSVSIALNASGSVTATALYAPYGVVRYKSGAMPTSYGYTDQRLDGSGLSYYHARYYDSTVGQFTSADSVDTRGCYSYVHGNPETTNDPTGHCAKGPRNNTVFQIMLLLSLSIDIINQQTGGKFNVGNTDDGSGVSTSLVEQIRKMVKDAENQAKEGSTPKDTGGIDCSPPNPQATPIPQKHNYNGRTGNMSNGQGSRNLYSIVDSSQVAGSTQFGTSTAGGNYSSSVGGNSTVITGPSAGNTPFYRYGSSADGGRNDFVSAFDASTLMSAPVDWALIHIIMTGTALGVAIAVGAATGAFGGNGYTNSGVGEGIGGPGFESLGGTNADDGKDR